jgi:hypothetical protein
VQKSDRSLQRREMSSKEATSRMSSKDAGAPVHFSGAANGVWCRGCGSHSLPRSANTKFTGPAARSPPPPVALEKPTSPQLDWANYLFQLCLLYFRHVADTRAVLRYPSHCQSALLRTRSNASSLHDPTTHTAKAVDYVR